MFILPISPFKVYHHLLDRDSHIMIFANFPNYNELNIFLWDVVGVHWKIPKLARGRKKYFTYYLGATSLVVQCLRLQCPKARGPSSIPGQETGSYIIMQLRLAMAK